MSGGELAFGNICCTVLSRLRRSLPITRICSIASRGMENGSGTVDVGDCIASVSGQAMAAGEAWDGKLEVEDYTTKYLPLAEA